MSTVSTLTRSPSIALRLATGAIGVCLAWSTAMSAPYNPSSKDEVLIELDARQQAASAALRSARNAADPLTAADTAARFIALGRSQHDERFFGYASAALQNWRDDSRAPEAIVLLRADIAQHQHRFADAHGILNVLIDRNPNHANARLMRATLRMTQGQPTAARQDCQRLFALRESFAATICLAQTASLTGQLAESYRLVSTLLAPIRIDGGNPQHAWALGVAADMAERSADLPAAEQYLRTALNHAPDDLVSRLQLADILLEQRRALEVQDLLAGLIPSDPILLRRALAEKQLGTTSKAQMEWRMAIERSNQLGVTLHLRELARGQLELLDAPQQALSTAQSNWAVQREPIDARLLAATARAANDARTLEHLTDWQRQLRFEDAGLKL